MRRIKRNSLSSWASGLTVLAMLSTGIVSTATAAPIVGYQLRISSDLRLLKAPTDPNVRMLVSKKNKYDMMIDRMMPYFELQNTSDEASLESWQFSVGKVDYNFEDLQILDVPTSSVGSASAQSLLPLGTPSADLVAMNFTGLTPGQSVTGRISLGADNSSIMEVPDFRNVLFQMDSPESPQETSNATIRTVFSDGSTLEGTLPNFTHDEAALGMALIPCSNESFFEQEVFQYGQQAESIQPIPEPGTFLLAALGIACLIGKTLIRRRR